MVPVCPALSTTLVPAAWAAAPAAPATAATIPAARMNARAARREIILTSLPLFSFGYMPCDRCCGMPNGRARGGIPTLETRPPLSRRPTARSRLATGFWAGPPSRRAQRTGRRRLPTSSSADLRGGYGGWAERHAADQGHARVPRLSVRGPRAALPRLAFLTLWQVWPGRVPTALNVSPLHSSPACT